MKSKMIRNVLMIAVIASMLLTNIASADLTDGRKLRRNVSKTPDSESGDAAMSMMKFYVPAQASDGSLTTVEYDVDDAGDLDTDPATLSGSRDYAKPLVFSYINDVAEHEEEEHEELSIASGVGFGARDTFIALSLDDGTTWKRTNVSNHAHLSSFTLADGDAYPGDTAKAVHAVAGDRVLAAWISKYCSGGEALYTKSDEEILEIQSYMGLPEIDDDYVFFADVFGVAGAQKSIDYTEQGFPEVGEVPFGCVWTARGELVTDEDTGNSEIVWAKPERLTSGRRDPNRLEIAAAKDAGFAIVWQEDPLGLRPGTGLGPGEGWSGAIANAKTDVWYSYITWDNFDVIEPVADADDVTLSTYDGTETPKVFVPMAMPVRISDNNMCTNDGTLNEPYCYADFSDDWTTVSIPDTQGSSDTATFCSDIVNIELGEQSTGKDVCVTDDSRVLMGRVAGTRPRVALHGYDTDADGIDDSAWFIVGYEETKALGEGADSDNPIDEGKNQWYHSFDMANPDLVSHGNMLNQPAMDPLSTTPEDPFYELQNTLEFMDLGAYNYDFYETEIARRFSLISQGVDEAMASESGLAAYVLVKQGLIKQGGPADIYGQRFILPDDFDPAVDNPYAFENLDCDNWNFVEEYNPYYPKGVCLDTPAALSATTAQSCEGSDCPLVADVYSCDEVTGVCEWDTGIFPKVTEWVMAGPDYSQAVTDDTIGNLDDQSWENPYDIAKGHRGFVDGDFLMVIYAWSPNYKGNAIGHDHYNLYARRSFDGGVTWTTTPASWMGETYDGTIFTENWYTNSFGGLDPYEVTYDLGAGEFEPARNLSQLVGQKETILDPRYAPTAGDITQEDGSFLYTDDERDHSRFFIVYETGDNTTVTTGEATPLNLYFSRATEWGDEYDEVPASNDETIEVWDWMEKGEPESGEASICANPGGNFFYGAWNQALEIGEEEFTDMDAYHMRVIYPQDVDLDPIGEFQYISSYAVSFGEVITMIGGGKDMDYMGEGDDIVEYEWTSSIQGKLPSTGRTFSMEAGTGPGKLWAGWHTIGFRVKDNEGNWSQRSETTILVGEEISFMYMPMAIR